MAPKYSNNKTTILLRDKEVIGEKYVVDLESFDFEPELSNNSQCCLGYSVTNRQEQVFLKLAIRPTHMSVKDFVAKTEEEYVRLVTLANTASVVNALDFIYNPKKRQAIIVMEYLGEEWKNLHSYLDDLELDYKNLDEASKWTILKNVYQSLLSVVESGYYHHDIKDFNVMVNTVTMQTKLIDFGSCISTKAVDPPFNGSEYYGPPEAIGGDPFDVSKSESYSFGMLAFSIFYGAKLPFAFNLSASERDIGKSMEEFEAILNEERPFHISPNAKLLIKTLMEVDVNIRPAFDGITQLKCFNSEDSDLTLLPEPVLPTEGRKGVEEGSSRSVFGRYWDNCRAMIRSISCFSRNRD